MGGVGGGGQGGFADITHNIPLLVLLSEHSRYCSRATVPHSWGKHCLLLTVISGFLVLFAYCTLQSLTGLKVLEPTEPRVNFNDNQHVRLCRPVRE